jgi:ribulose-phosphate 3-epimerase
MIIAPSLLASDYANLESEISKVSAVAPWIHVDVMDGHFVPNLTLGAPIVKSIRKVTDLFIDCHLMVTDPHRYFEDFTVAGADMICFHAEATVPFRKTDKTLERLKQYDVKRGMAISPDTELNMIKDYLPELDMVLLMTVFPGFGGQSLIPKVLDKAVALREMMGPDFLIQIDGGVTTETIGAAAKAGVNVCVAGSSVYGQKDPAQAVQDLLTAAKVTQ